MSDTHLWTFDEDVPRVNLHATWDDIPKTDTGEPCGQGCAEDCPNYLAGRPRGKCICEFGWRHKHVDHGLTLVWCPRHRHLAKRARCVRTKYTDHSQRQTSDGRCRG